MIAYADAASVFARLPLLSLFATLFDADDAATAILRAMLSPRCLLRSADADADATLYADTPLACCRDVTHDVAADMLPRIPRRC